MQESQNIMQPHRPQWKTRTGFLMAAIGSAIGLGNIWRFPYLCYENGGGAFLIPYIVALVVAGIPLMILELGIGQKMRGSCPMSFAKINKHWEWLGWWAVIFVMFGIVLYYSVIISWCLNYLFLSFDLSWGSSPNNYFFQNFLNLTEGPHQFGDIRTKVLFGLAIIWFFNWLIVFSGVQRGVERANRIFMPILFALTAILVVWSINLKGAYEGIRWYLRPDFSLLSKPRVWIDAFSQIFFTLSIGFGIMVAYASYLPRKEAIVKDAVTISVTNCLYSIFAAFAVFGTLGYMSNALSKPIEDVVQESIGLAFVVYPQAISLLPYFARIFGIIFFSTLVVAGLSSSVSILEAFSSAVMDKFHYSRKTIVSILAVLGFLGGTIFSSGGGLYWLDIVDHFLTNYGLVVVGILECILVGWLFKAKRFREYINHISHFTLGRWWDICVKFIIPVVLGIILINDLLKEFIQPYGGYPLLANILIGRDWLLVTLIAALIVAGHPWKVDLHSDEK